MRTGIDRLAVDPKLAKAWGHCALVANQASTDEQIVPSWSILHKIIGQNLVAIFGPQHGFESTVQENMIETGHGRHLHTGLPVYSLYSETREPTDEMLANIDTIVFDLQITGCRIYTYKYTLAGCLRAAKRLQKRVVILDRHNPLGGCLVEGNTLNPKTKSFVGEYALPMRHGLTMAEAGQFFNRDIQAELEIVPLTGWQPEEFWPQYGRPWVLTSPNLPTMEAVYTFPGTVLFEGCNISEGRGTCLPFLFFGAPFLANPRTLIEAFSTAYGGPIDGVRVREASFEPGFSKWQGETCHGIQLHVIHPEKMRPVRLGIALLRAFAMTCGERFEWRPGPYEYNHALLPIQLLFGSLDLHEQITSDRFDISDPAWHLGAQHYIDTIEPYLLYERQMRVNL